MTVASPMDYLDVLAAKSLGVLDSIRPRLPSLFEPAPPSVPSSVDATSVSALVRGVSVPTVGSEFASGGHTYRPARTDLTGESFDSHLPDDSVEHRQPRRRAEVRSAPRRPAPDTASEGQGNVAQRPPTFARSPGESEGQREPHPPEVRADSRPEVTVIERASMRDDRQSARIAPSLAPTPSPSARVAFLEGAMASPISRGNMDESTPAYPATPPKPPMPRSEAPPSAEPVRPIMARLAPARTWAAPSHKETVVQVTIGRVEVKAVPPPTPAARKPPSPPVMSLDEYLRQRSSRGAP